MCRDGHEELFNVIVMYVSDLGHEEEVLRRTQVTYTYGCPHCKKNRKELNKITSSAPALTTKYMLNYGRMEERKLGLEPNKDTPGYTTFHQAHFGQIVS